MFDIYNPWKLQKTSGFLPFSYAVEMERGLKMGFKLLEVLVVMILYEITTFWNPIDFLVWAQFVFCMQFRNGDFWLPSFFNHPYSVWIVKRWRIFQKMKLLLKGK